ncbi:MAG: hypothetical protein H0Z34_11090 [Brevibacillus sp.]|nr:hypothetical protein [Brevibacillus sp.]
MNTQTWMALFKMGFVILILSLAVVIIVTLIKTWQTKMQSGKEKVYQQLAEEAIELQKQTVENQKKLAEELHELKKRVASIEKILREVE